MNVFVFIFCCCADYNIAPTVSYNLIIFFILSYRMNFDLIVKYENWTFIDSLKWIYWHRYFTVKLHQRNHYTMLYRCVDTQNSAVYSFCSWKIFCYRRKLHYRAPLFFIVRMSICCVAISRIVVAFVQCVTLGSIHIYWTK